jgi:hypothetical protein
MMGMTAGGKIKQNIIKDGLTPRAYSKEPSRRVFVIAVNSAVGFPRLFLTVSTLISLRLFSDVGAPHRNPLPHLSYRSFDLQGQQPPVVRPLLRSASDRAGGTLRQRPIARRSRRHRRQLSQRRETLPCSSPTAPRPRQPSSLLDSLEQARLLRLPPLRPPRLRRLPL